MKQRLNNPNLFVSAQIDPASSPSFNHAGAKLRGKLSSGMLSTSTIFESFEMKGFKLARILNKGVSSETFLSAIYYFYLFFIAIFSLFLIVFHGIGGEQPYAGLSGLTGFLLHVIPGAFFFIISLFQFNASYRQNSLSSHRLFGKIYFALQAIAWVGVALLWMSSPLEGGIGSYLGTPIFLGYWFITGWYAYKNAVVGNIPAHHTWIIRNSVFAFAIVLMRPLTVAIAISSNMKITMSEALGVSIYFCFIVLFLLGEWSIYARFTDSRTNVIEYISSDPPLVELPVSSALKISNRHTASHIPRKRLSGSKFISMSLVSRHSYTNSSLLRFKVEQPDTLSTHITLPYFPIAPTHHISIRSIVPYNDAFVQLIRSYTPISTSYDHRNGYIDILVGKRGKFSTHLVTMPIGSRVSVMPQGIGSYVYESNAQPQVTMIAAGTGITPIFSLLRNMVEDATSSAEIKLLWFGREECELKSEIEMYREKSKDFGGAKVTRVEFKVGDSKNVEIDALNDWLPDMNVVGAFYKSESWNRATGRKACVFVCGPLEMERNIVEQLRKKQVERRMIWAFGLDGR